VQAGTPYVIIGNQQSVHDYSEILYPMDVRNCTSCHPAEAAQGHVWYSEPSRAACGACHDDLDWVTGMNHAGDRRPTTRCAASATSRRATASSTPR